MALHLTTLGGLRTRRDDIDLDWLPSRRLRAGLFVYLAVERRASRETLAALFWPESSDDNARHALRQCLYHLRRDLGDDWVEVRGHELIASDAVKVDVHEFTAALERGAAAAAARLYRGPFLAGVNLLDLQSWESWVEGRRLHYARAFRKACRTWVDSLEAAGDLRGAIEAAQHWTAPDPFDDEAQQRLVQALVEAGERSSALRQYESYERLLEAEGLHPLDEMTALIEQAREPLPDATVLTPAPDEIRGAPRPPPGPPPGPQVIAEGDAHAATRNELTPARNEHTPAPAARRRRLRLAVAAGVVVLAVGAARALMPGEPESPVMSSDLAVFPFSVRGSGHYLGDGMVTLLGTALDGATVRPVDARAVLGLVAQDGGVVPDLESGARLASRLGAGMYVLGDVIEAGDRVQIEAAVYRTGSGDAIAHGSATGEGERVFELVDALAAQLLADLRPAGDVLTRTAAATTTSLAAFKHYLEGEAELRAGRFERGIEAYGRAIALDSTFAVAHYRLALGRDWAAQAGSEDAARAASRHAARLAPRDRAHLDAYLAYIAGDADDAERRYRTILARYPEDPEAWLHLAEVLFHYGSARGRPAAEAEEAWRRVVVYDHRSLSAVLHLARIAASDGRVALLDSLLAHFTADERSSDRRLLQVELLRAIAARDSTALHDLMDDARRWEDAAVWQLAAYITAYSSEPAGARRALDRLIERRRPPWLNAELHWFTALLHLENGQLAPARQSLAHALAANATIEHAAHRRTFELVTEWWMATLPMPHPDSMLERVRSAASSAALPAWSNAATAAGDVPMWLEVSRDAFGTGGRMEALRLFTIGHLSLRLGDAAAAERASDALTRLAAPADADGFVRSLDRELRARRVWHRGDPAEALRILGDEPPPLESVAATGVVPFLAHAQQRFLRGELLIALGRDADALPWFASIGRLSVPEAAMRAQAHLRQAEIHERLGNRTDALRHRAEFRRLTAS